MTRGRWWAALALGCAALVTTVAGSWWLGRQHALDNLAFVDVSASTAARAMQDDHFYSDYGDKILVIEGTVTNVQNAGGGRQISMRTDSPFGLTCDLAAPSTVGQPAAGEVISVVAPGASAHRQPSSVDLPDCRMMSGR